MALRLQFKGIRCFNTEQNVVVRPLTLLVGENSTGKSTFLAIRKIASAIVGGFAEDVSFNEPPFLLGAYDQIASYMGGRAGRAKSFSVAACLDGKQRGSIYAEFASVNGQPAVDVWRLSVDDLVWEVELGGRPSPSALLVQSSLGSRRFKHIQDLGVSLQLHFRHFAPTTLNFLRESLPLAGLEKVLTETGLEALGKAMLALRREVGQGTYAFAPIRTSPRRTYDPVTAESEPEGSHVPMLLARLSRPTANGQWGNLTAALKQYGTNSGLFDQIEVIRKGNKESDPFQIGVKSGGPTFNLVDVGYGVSQALPILVDTLQRSRNRETFLLQQPEVHLHPKAQAELGSFFARQAGRGERFVIETHSDALVDRVRMEIRSGAHIGIEDVALLYFERRPRGAQIYNIVLEKDGQIANPPKGYRQFFLNEERTLLQI